LQCPPAPHANFQMPTSLAPQAPLGAPSSLHAMQATLCLDPHALQQLFKPPQQSKPPQPPLPPQQPAQIPQPYVPPVQPATMATAT
jgi:hypothetical protein